MKIFISYNTLDERKVDILSYIISNNRLEPIIVERKRKPLEQLTRMVEESIEESTIVIPILTRRSMQTQWINQEIGIALATDKTVIPIVEAECIGELRGFIHNQIQLPYNYNKSDDIESENESFSLICEQLINDVKKNIAINVPRKSQAELNLESLKNYVIDEKLEKNKRLKMQSPNLIIEAREEVFKGVIGYAKKQKESWDREFGCTFPIEEIKSNPYGYLIRIKNWSIVFIWFEEYSPVIKDSYLRVSVLEGSAKFQGGYFPCEEPKSKYESKFSVDLDQELNVIWSNSSGSKTSAEVVDLGFRWLLEVMREDLLK